jgi:hypothetical protein
MDYVNIVLKAIDIPMVIGLVIVIQMLKKVIKINSKWWALAIIILGFVAAWLKAPVDASIKDLIVTGFIYTSGMEFVYQGMRTVKDTLNKGKK